MGLRVGERHRLAAFGDVADEPLAECEAHAADRAAREAHRRGQDQVPEVGADQVDRAHVRVEALRDEIDDVAERLAEIPELDYVVLTAGSFDLMAEVVCENDEELITLLNSRIRNLPGVHSTETFVYLKLQKQFYNWGTR